MPPTEMKPTPAATPTSAGKKNAPPQWDVSKLDDILIEAFILLRGDRLLTRASNEWKRVVEKVPDLAKGEYPLALADIVEVALVSCCATHVLDPVSNNLPTVIGSHEIRR